jgi:hypothetical protein
MSFVGVRHHPNTNVLTTRTRRATIPGKYKKGPDSTSGPVVLRLLLLAVGIWLRVA